MQVVKFGGGILKDPNGVKQMVPVLLPFEGKMIVVVSAFGKTTNALEMLAERYFHRSPSVMEKLDEIRSFHQEMIGGLFPAPGLKVHARTEEILKGLLEFIGTRSEGSFDQVYDHVVAYGEILSSMIVSEYLKSQCILNEWVDIRTCLKTDDYFREARIHYEKSGKLLKKVLSTTNADIIVTQGFIGSTADGLTTTLGREGSDYTAAILANLLDAEQVIIFKDVPGILNADPRWMPDAQKLDEISYQEAIELSYFGAQVIHPKTIKPLQNKNIPLRVTSFFQPAEAGTTIHQMDHKIDLLPVFIRKVKQVLISIWPKDFSFFVDESLDHIFGLFIKHKIKINLVQNSAISITLCADYRDDRFANLLKDLQEKYNLRYNENLTLYTIRHYNDEAIEKVLDSKEVLIEQKTRGTVHFVVKD
jgi:aspartate kinase